MTTFYSPINHSPGESDAVASTTHITRYRTLPIAYRTTVIHGYEFVIGAGESGVVYVSLECARAQGEGGDGAMIRIFGYESVAERVIYLEIIELQFFIVQCGRVDVCSQQGAGGVIKG